MIIVVSCCRCVSSVSQESIINKYIFFLKTMKAFDFTKGSCLSFLYISISKEASQEVHMRAYIFTVGESDIIFT